MIDFSSLVLAPCMDVFAKPVTVTPKAGGPGGPSYEARGIYDEKPVDVALEDGRILGTTQKTLGIRLADFPDPLAQGDVIEIDGQRFLVDDTDDDGQGGSVVTLKEWKRP